jgi:hypothetical protein
MIFEKKFLYLLHKAMIRLYNIHYIAFAKLFGET